MKRKWKVWRGFYLLSLIFILLITYTGCAGDDNKEITSLEQLCDPGRKIGVSLNCPEEKQIKEDFPEAEIIVYTDIQIGYKDVATGRIDAYVASKVQMRTAIKHGTQGVRLLDAVYAGNPVGVGISPKCAIPDFKEKLDSFIDELKTDGTIDDMRKRWVEDDNYTMPDIPEAQDPSTHLRVATVGTLEPFSYYEGNELTGLDIELAKRFAYWLNADLEFKVYDFSGIIAAAQSGDADCVMANLYYDAERAEAIPFSEVLFDEEVAVMVRDDASGAGPVSLTGLWKSLKFSFERTFIREDRWQLFVNGIITTLLIAVLSVALGTILGLVMYMICYTGNSVINSIIAAYNKLVNRLPIVVLLMILYYIVFVNVDVSGMFVSIIGFSMLFGCGMFALVKTGVGAIDKGQLEAAYSLGYTKRKAFFRIILPQALPHFMPAFKGQITSIIKATSVVGYIAVQDLTKIGDIIRSRTYDAFFPLIAIAVIYFLMVMFLTFIVEKIEIHIDPRQRKPEKIRREVEG